MGPFLLLLLLFFRILYESFVYSTDTVSCLVPHMLKHTLAFWNLKFREIQTKKVTFH